MNKIRVLFLAVFLGFGALRSEAGVPVMGEALTFSMLCQYTTNIMTNAGPVRIANPQMRSVLVTSADISRSIERSVFGRNFTSEGPMHTDWAGANIVFERNLSDGTTGIYLRVPSNQVEVTSYFDSRFTNNGYLDVFSGEISNVFAESLLVDSNAPTTLEQGFINTSDGNTNFNFFESLAYVNVDTTNLALKLFGYATGQHVPVIFRGKSYSVPQAEIFASGTFKLNLATNLFDVTNGYTYTVGKQTNVATHVIPPAYYYGIAHGTIVFSPPYVFSVPKWP